MRKHGEAYKIVQALVKVLADALSKGKEVKIQGFGIFKPHTYAPRKTLFYYNQFKDANGNPLREPRTIPERTHIKFFPSKALERFINAPNQKVAP